MSITLPETTRERDEEFSYLSFRMHDEFFDGYRDRQPRWGFPIGAGNTLGEHSWITKYARRKANGGRERFWEGLRRVIEGMYSIQKDHAERYKLPWDEEMAHRSAQEAYERAFAGKWSPPGRGLWMMGTNLVNARHDSSALQNCAFLSTENLPDNPTLPFMRMMDMSMLGVGVGFDTRGAGKVTISKPLGEYTYEIADSREGWCESLGALLNAFINQTAMPIFDYTLIRPAGSPIRGFGGIASGPGPLRKLHDQVTKLLSGREGQVLKSSDIVDIMNMAGKCVVSANVRRSAQIALGSGDDDEFLNLKDWRLNPERNGADGWGHLSNNSVIAHSGDDLSHIAQRIELNGEPGIFWLDMAQAYGRLVDPPNNRDYRTQGVNPCGEQNLENHELCTLVETYPINCTDMQDYLRTLKFAYLYGKTVTLLMTRWPETNEVMIRNRRIGTSMTGVAQFAETYGWAELRRWQDAGYQEIRRWDKMYSEWLGVRESIKVTTIKPSGTVALLHGVTPGVHWPRERGFYIRTVRDIKDSPLVKVMEEAGYPVEPSFGDPETTVVISMPTEGPDIRPEREVSIWEKTALAAQCQRWWSDNSVSCTIGFSEAEVEEIPAVLRAYDGQLKSISFLPMSEKVYQQAPYQRVSREEWEIMRRQIKPINWNALYDEESTLEPQGELFCNNDSCEIPR